jgi:5-methylcytosine-specific restriction endonuclease McrA
MIKSKPCTVEGCERPRFAKGYCKVHQGLRTDKKPKTLKKRTEKGQEKKELKKALFPNDMAFYLRIWMKRPHECYNCGKNLGIKPLTLYFDHILEKGNPKYEHLRHVEENICLLCWDCHTNKALLPKLTQLREETKEKLCKIKNS